MYLVNKNINSDILTFNKKIDLKNIDPIDNCFHIVGDFTDDKNKVKITAILVQRAAKKNSASNSSLSSINFF